MQNQNLQPLFGPQIQCCDIMSMHYRIGDGVKYDYTTGLFTLPFQGTLTSDTYFNLFSFSKWDTYTNISCINVQITIQGNADIYLMKSILSDEQIIDSVVDYKQINCKEKETVFLQFDFSREQFDGIAYIKIVANKSDVFFGGASYTTAGQPILQPVKLALIMCTFKRERYVYNNLQLLEKLHDSAEQDVPVDFEVFVIDNGHTLDASEFNKNYLHLIPNKNVGGAGGFTRGIITVLKQNKFSHVVLMDDDALIDPNVLKKTYTFLQHVKPPFQKHILGGATLRLDKMNIQLESGDVWNNNILFNLKRNVDLTQKINLFKNEKEESISYNSWVYCCIPCSAISLDDLPLPLFVRGDDMEYGLRHRNGIITLNGLGVWHAPIAGRYSFSMNYYVARNQLVLNALYDKKFTARKAAMQLLRSVRFEIIRFRYGNVELLLRAYKDFLGGVDFFEKHDGEKLHKEILALCPTMYNYLELERNGYPFTVDKLNIAMEEGESKGIKKILRMLTLYGYFLPRFLKRKGDMENFGVTDLFYAKTNNFYRRNCVVQIDSFGKRGVITKRSLRKAIKCFMRSIHLAVVICIGGYKKAVSSYHQNVKVLKTQKFWEKYLGISEE
ncbi:hypothetical protein A7X67_18620 [Clostridium sp. W14A]|nr:hypothetical protein A7X67_18620 [Clostridium sp. W14A]